MNSQFNEFLVLHVIYKCIIAFLGTFEPLSSREIKKNLLEGLISDDDKRKLMQQLSNISIPNYQTIVLANALKKYENKTYFAYYPATPAGMDYQKQLCDLHHFVRRPLLFFQVMFLKGGLLCSLWGSPDAFNNIMINGAHCEGANNRCNVKTIAQDNGCLLLYHALTKNGSNKWPDVFQRTAIWVNFGSK